MHEVDGMQDSRAGGRIVEAEVEEAGRIRILRSRIRVCLLIIMMSSNCSSSTDAVCKY